MGCLLYGLAIHSHLAGITFPPRKFHRQEVATHSRQTSSHNVHLKTQILSIRVEDKPGVLTRISSLFSRRGYNIISLSVGNTHEPSISQFTIEVEGDEFIVEQIKKQCQKLVHVITAEKVDPEKDLIREFSLITVKLDDTNREHIMHIIDEYNPRMLRFSENVVVLEFSGSETKINSMIKKIDRKNIIELIRSGSMALKSPNRRTHK